jgi:hypothetical protein
LAKNRKTEVEKNPFKNDSRKVKKGEISGIQNAITAR